MTAAIQPESKSPSRRALLVGAVGGLGALAVSAFGRPQVAAGHDVDDVRLGGANTATTTTQITNSTTGQTVFSGVSSGGTGVLGQSNTSVGVYGNSGAGTAVYGLSNSGVSVWGDSSATNYPASLGRSYGNSTGVQGFSGIASIPAAPAKTGVYGSAAQDSASKGVWGSSPAGHGLHGSSSSGFAGYFAGKVYTSKFIEMTEISAPAAPGANKARLFLRVSGTGKTQLCVRFQSGSVQVIKTEP